MMMNLLLAFGTILLSGMAVPETIRASAASSPIVVLAERGGDPVIAVEFPTAVYPTNNLSQLWHESGEAWRAEYFESAELVCVYRKAFAVNRDKERQASLYYPDWCAKQVLDLPTEIPKKSIAEGLQASALVSRFEFGQYSILSIREESPTLGRSVYWPYVVRRVDSGYRATLEVVLNSSVQFACGILAKDIAEGTRKIVDDQKVNHLERFQIELNPPRSEGDHTSGQILWKPKTSAGDPNNDGARSFLYLALDADPAKGFGREILGDDAENSVAAAGEGVTTFLSLFRGAWNEDDIKKEKSFWQSRHHQNMEAQAARLNTGLRRPPKTTKWFPALTSGPVDQHARLIASVDFGGYSLHFLQNPESTAKDSGKVFHIAQVVEDGQPRLAESLGSMGLRQGAISGLLTTPEFKAAIAEFARKRQK